MQITERVDIENIGETRCQTEILEKAREHVPGITLQEDNNSGSCKLTEK